MSPSCKKVAAWIAFCVCVATKSLPVYSLEVSAPTITKTFTPDSISAGGTSTLTYTLTNLNASPLTGVQFEDTYSAAIVNTTPLEIG